MLDPIGGKLTNNVAICSHTLCGVVWIRLQDEDNEDSDNDAGEKDTSARKTRHTRKATATAPKTTHDFMNPCPAE